MTARLPVTVIGGYLGAGKTTLVNHLLRTAGGLRLAILVNDFGALAIDADLIEARAEDLISIAGGCVCCAFGSDLMGALMTMAQRSPPPDHLLIETSGVALPGIVAKSVALLPACAVDGVVVVADAETVQAQAADRYVGDTVARQLAEADLVILNKGDLVAAERAASLRVWMRQAAPRARVVAAERAAVTGAVVYGQRPATASGIADAPSATRYFARLADADAIFEAASFALDTHVDAQRLAAALAASASGIIRAKGVVRGADGRLSTLHVVGSRVEVAPFQGAAAVTTGLACIGLRGELDRGEIERVIEGAAAPPIV